MQPKLLMICIILRSSAAAFATPYSRRSSGVIGTVASGLKLGGCTKNIIARGGGGNNVRTAVTIIDDEYNNNEAPTSSSTSLHQTSRRNAAASSYYETTTTSNNSPPINNEQISNNISTGHIAYRLARRSDISQIQSVNLSTLPENYNSNFYLNHMKHWPELTLVAEHIPEGYDSGGISEEEEDGRITPLRDYIRGKKQQQQLYNQNSSSGRPQKEIVGYILGKIEPRPIHPPQRQIFSPPLPPPMMYNTRQDERSSTLMQYINGNNNNNGRGSSVRFPSSIRTNNRYNNSQQQSKPKQNQPYERIGHVTSLAIHKHARRLGIATQLINQLHYNLQTCYNAQSIGLHVRISNEAAVQLYVEGGYNVDDIIPCYYEDGEDAYFMRKDFEIKSSDLVQVSENIPLYQPPPQSQQQHQPPQGEKRWRRGEKERNDFFNSRTSMRDTMSDEERAWVNRNNNNGVMSASPAAGVARGYNNNNNNVSRRPTTTSSSTSSSISGQFKQRVFSTFFNTNSTGGSMQSSSTQQWRQQQQMYNQPPWEVGPEELRLPRYIKVCGRDEQQSLQQQKQQKQATAGAGTH